MSQVRNDVTHSEQAFKSVQMRSGAEFDWRDAVWLVQEWVQVGVGMGEMIDDYNGLCQW